MKHLMSNGFFPQVLRFKRNKTKSSFLLSSHNSRIVGLILMNFVLEDFTSPLRLFYAIYKIV
jgi:hypothetical protein